MSGDCLNNNQKIVNVKIFILKGIGEWFIYEAAA